MRKALAGRRAMYRALKHRGYKKTKVTGLSDQLNSFKMTPHSSPLEKKSCPPKGDLCKVVQQVFHQHWLALGQMQFCPFALQFI